MYLTTPFFLNLVFEIVIKCYVRCINVVLASVLELRGRLRSAVVLQDHNWETGINCNFYSHLCFLDD